MKKIITLSLLALFLATTMSAQVNLAKRFNPVAGNVAAKNNAKSVKAKTLNRTKATPLADGEGLAATTILAEDFSKFTAGSESAHDATRLDDADGFTPEQRFYLAYANLWAGNIREEEILNRTKTDPHSLGKLRVNATLKNIVEFYNAFGIKEGDKMWMPEAERVIIW